MGSSLKHAFIILGILAPSVLPAQETREITWDDLLPKKDVPFDDPFEKLTEDQLFELGLIARRRRRT